MGKVFFVKGRSAHGNIHRMLDAFRRQFAALGVAGDDFDTTDPASYRNLVDHLGRGQVRMLLCMNLGARPLVANAEWLAGQHVHFYALDPVHSVLPDTSEMAGLFPRLTISCTDALRARLAGRLLGRPVAMLPHAADPDTPEGPSWAERSDTLVFAGNLHSGGHPDRMPERWKAGQPALWPYLEAALDAVAESEYPEETVFAMMAERFGITDIGIAGAVAHRIEQYLHSRFRWDAIVGLARRHRIVVYGSGWEEAAAAAGPLAEFRGPKDAVEVAAETAGYRLALNLEPPWHRSHERIFDGAARGQLPVTAENPWLRQALGDGPAYYSTPAALAEAIEAVHDRGAERAAAVRAAVMAGHTWTHRATALLALAET